MTRVDCHAHADQRATSEILVSLHQFLAAGVEASTLAIPAKYYDLMQKEKPELLAENVNVWLDTRQSNYMIRSMDYGAGPVARALLSERYRRIDNMEMCMTS